MGVAFKSKPPPGGSTIGTCEGVRIAIFIGGCHATDALGLGIGGRWLIICWYRVYASRAKMTPDMARSRRGSVSSNRMSDASFWTAAEAAIEPPMVSEIRRNVSTVCAIAIAIAMIPTTTDTHG